MQALGIALESKHCINDCDNAELHSLAKQFPQKSELIVGIPATEMLFQKISADHALSDDDLMTFLSSRLTQLFGTAANTLLWDYEKHSKDNQQEITIIGAQKKTINGIKKLFQSHNIVIKAIEPTAFALVRKLLEKTDVHNCYAIIPTEDAFLFITIFHGKIFHCETLTRSQLSQLSLMIQFDYPFYFISSENESRNIISSEFIGLKNEINSQKISLTCVSLNSNASLATWKKS